jgi:mRNA interferase MazF
MPNYSKTDVILVRYPFSTLSAVKVRPAVVASGPHSSRDVFIVPLTSRVAGLLLGEFTLDRWDQAGLHIPTALKRGLFTIHESLILRTVGRLAAVDAERMDRSLRDWLGLG